MDGAGALRRLRRSDATTAYRRGRRRRHFRPNQLNARARRPSALTMSNRPPFKSYSAAGVTIELGGAGDWTPAEAMGDCCRLSCNARKRAGGPSVLQDAAPAMRYGKQCIARRDRLRRETPEHQRSAAETSACPGLTATNRWVTTQDALVDVIEAQLDRKVVRLDQLHNASGAIGNRSCGRFSSRRW